MAIIDELLVGLGFDYNPDDLEQFNKDIDSTINSVKAMAKAVVVGTTALVGFTAATTAASDRQGKLANQTGITVEELDALEFAIKRTGGESSALANNLEQLAIRTSEAARGIGSGVEAFGILGISATDANGNVKDTNEVLLEAADALQGLGKTQQIELADKLGLKDSILLLQEGSVGIRELTREAKAFGVTTSEDAAVSAEFQDSLTNIFQITKQVSRVLTRSLVPILESVTETFEEWWLSNREIIEQNIPAFVDSMTRALKFLVIAGLAFISLKMITTLMSMVKLLKAASVSALLLNGAIALIPTLIAGMVLAIGLLAEDAKAFFEGSESFIGDMIEKYPEWADEIRAVAAVFAVLADLTTMIFEGWRLIFEFFSSGTVIEDFKLVMKQLLTDIKEGFVGLKDSISETFDDIWQDVKDSFFSNVIEPIINKFNQIKDLFSFSSDSEDTTTENNSISNIVESTQRNVEEVVNQDVQRDITDNTVEDIKALMDNASFVQSMMVQSSEQSTDNIVVMQGLSSEEMQPNTAITNDVNTSNTSAPVKLEVGGITVEVTTNATDAEATGQAVAQNITKQLEPILKQASLDLNSQVEV